MNTRLTFAVGNSVYQENRIFSKEMRDQANACFISLKGTLEVCGCALATEDIHPVGRAALVIDFDVQKWERGPKSPNIPVRYLITIEPPVVRADNWSTASHRRYDKIFTWNDSLVDNRKYFLLRYAHNLGVDPGLPSFEDRQFAAMIVGFKASSSPQQLYSARFETIRWFLQCHPAEFHLYGAGWPSRFRPPLPSRVERFLSRPMDALLAPFYKTNVCYYGPVKDKVRTFGNYRFAFCYENTHSAPGYITEKIFDAFRAGCVPVYLGPPNASEHIPPDCFIDRSHFANHEELYSHLKRISAGEFLRYQERIRTYLQSPQAQQFTPSYFAEILRTHVLSDLGNTASTAIPTGRQ